MRPRVFVRRSLRHNASHHAPAVLGAALAGAVLLASLYVGDSVRGGLEELTRARHAGIGVRVVAQAGPLREELARSLAADLGRPALPVWHLEGTLATRDGSVELQSVHVYGVHDAFWETWSEAPPPKGVHRVSESLSAELSQQGAPLGDLVFRGRPLSSLAGDTPLAATDAELTPVPIWGSPYAGLPSRVGPPQQAAEPRNVFVPLAWLQDQLALGATATEIWVPYTGFDSEKIVHRAELSLVKHFKPADVGLTFTERSGAVAVRSESLLLPKAVADRSRALPHRRAHLTWFVDTVASHSASAPFSFVSAVSAPDAGELRGLKEGEGLVNQWLAEDLKLQVGDKLTLRYHRVEDAGSGLPRGETSVIVAKILPMRGLGSDRTLTPDFPGITSAKRCRDWDPGVAMDRTRIRERDEEYWQLHGAAPKVILPLTTGQALWGSRFGDLNEVLLREPDALAAADNVLAATAPSALGIQVQNISAAALGAERPATDFGVLFLGFSAVLIVASLLLTGMLFRLSIERRVKEVLTLRRIGLPEARIRSLYQREALSLATVAMLGAIALAPLLSTATLSALQELWPDSIGGLSTPIERTWFSTSVGALSSAFLVYFVQSRALRKALQGVDAGPPVVHRAALSRASVFLFGAVAGGVLALPSTSQGVAPDAAFFGLGATFLAGSLAGVKWLLSASPGGRPWSSFVALAVRGMQRSPSRSLTVIVSLALTAFLVVGVGAHAPSPHGEGRVDGPTGGFALMVETTTGLSADVRHAHGRERLGLLEEDLEGVSLWPLRVRPGDDASCLSPGRAQRPRVLGIDSARLASRGAFTALSHSDGQALWSSLGALTPTGAIPVVGDEATLRWGLGLGVGDQWTDVSEIGEPVTYEVVGMFERSFLQGAVITSEAHLAERYPHTSETRIVLAEIAGAEPHKVAASLRSALGDLGASVQTTSAQLARFSRVETSYVRIFLAIGLLGVLLGAASVSVLLARNALARRREFATLRAMGQSRVAVWLYLTTEHFALILAGLCLGSTAAFVGLWPTLSTRSHEAPLAALLSLMGIVLLSLTLTSVVAWRCLDDEPAEVLTSNA